MNNWMPNDEEREYLQLVISMTADVLIGRGPATRKAYTDNLRAMADALDLTQPKDAKPA